MIISFFTYTHNLRQTRHSWGQESHEKKVLLWTLDLAWQLQQHLKQLTVANSCKMEADWSNLHD